MDGRAKVVTVEENKAVVQLDSGKKITFNINTDGVKVSVKLAAGMDVSYTLDKAGNLVSLAPDSMN